MEASGLEALGGLGPGRAILAVAGLGPIAAAAQTAALLARLRPSRVLLLGIAGSYDAASQPPGSAAEIGRVAIDGLETAGFSQVPGIGTTIALARESGKLLVTVLSSSGSRGEADLRRARHPGAAAEDMEGYGVALACAIARIPLAIVRGISNVAGESDHSTWRIRGALDAARQLAIEVLERPGAWPPPR